MNAVKGVMKVAAIIIGLFVVGLSYLSYKGRIDVKWVATDNTTRATVGNVAGQAVHELNNTEWQFAAYSSMLESSGLHLAKGFGFMPW